MKFKLLVRLVEKILHVSGSGEEPRGDMYLPEFLLAFALVLLGGGSAFGLLFLFVRNLWLLLLCAGGLGLGTVALLCWKNQSIRVISQEEFEYTTFLGSTRRYAFRDITGLRQNQDSLTLFVGKEKVHIESMAILSPRLVERINEALKTLE